MRHALRGLSFLGLSVWWGVQFAVPPFVVPVAAAELAEIQERGYLIVAVKDNWYPMGFRSESGELVGFEIDIARRLAQELLGDPNAVQFEPVSNVDRVNVVVEGEVDIAIATVTLTAARQRIATFSEPYYLDGVGFITRSSQVQTLEDLGNQRVALLNNSSTVAHVRYILPNAELIPVDAYQEALNLLETNQVDAFAGDITILTGWQQQDNRYRVLDSLISAEPLAIVIPKGTQYSPLRREINRLIRNWYDEGWLQERAAFWGLPAPAIPNGS
ncbi:MAG: transporter substrate-binding domain-containing protein [Cyanobacteria bacterium J06626_23]